MTRKLTKERIEWLNYAATGLAANGTEMAMSPQDVIALTEHCLAAMASEPVMYCMEGNGLDPEAVSTRREVVEAWVNEWNTEDRSPGEPIYSTVPLYRHAQQPTPERDQVRREHAEWSQATFGDVGPIGPLKHLSKEALEAAADPHDPLEWADMQFLFWDAQRRMGISDEFITRAMVEKLAINKARQWPEPKDGEPRLHIKEQPVPVVPCPFPCGWDNLNKLAIQNSALVARYLSEGEQVTEEIRQAAISNNDSLLKVIAACRAAMLQAGYAVRDLSTPVDPQVAEYEQNVMQAGNSPVIPDGYVMVPKEPTEDMCFAPDVRVGNKTWDRYQSSADMAECKAIYVAMLAAAPQEVKSES